MSKTTTSIMTQQQQQQKKSVENTVFVRFVPPPQHKVMRHQVEDIFSQIGPIKKSSWINSTKKPSTTNEDDAAATASASSSKGYGFVKYVAQQDAQAASKQLDNTKIQMEGQEYTLKVELASLSTPIKPKSEPEKHHAAANHDDDGNDDNDSLLSDKKKSCRIILRNLSFYAKEGQIRRTMEQQFGKVVDIHLPKVQNNLLGFGFVTFEDPDSAQKAVQQKQLELQKRTVQLDWSVPKNVHKQQQQKKQEKPPNKQLDDRNKEPTDKKTPQEDGDSDSDENDSDIENNNNDIDDGDSDDDSDNSSSAESSASDNEEKDVDEEDNDPAERDEDQQDNHDDAVDRKCCLFLRNLPFDTTRHDLFQLFSKYGYIKGIYLVRDKDTGMLKGTAFVTYSKSSSAQRAMDDAASATVPEGTGVASFVSQKDAHKDTTSNDSGGQGMNKGSLLLKGRKIFVDFAVNKETAATFDSKEHQVPSADRRNLYLQAESRVESSSTDPKANNANTWDDLPPQDQKKRQSALKDKTTKLQSPIFFINPHRLSFRNMAKHVDEAGLQQLCELAVTRGLEKRLVGPKDQIAHWKAKGEMTTREILAKVQTLEANNEDVIPPWDKSVNIKEYVPSVFIDRDFGPTGKKKDAPSRGFGFAEFTHHAHALACLRELNNNPAYSRDYAAGGKAADAMKKKSRKIKKNGAAGGDDNYIGDDGRVHIPRLIVDFTVENKIKAKKQAERRIHQQANQQKQKMEKKEKRKPIGEDGEETKKKQKHSRGAKQREKKRQKRESGEEEKERQSQLQAKALVEAKREMRKERLEQKRKLKEEMKRKAVKPPKKKQKHSREDQEDENLEKIVRSYAAELESTREGQQNAKNTLASVKQKRWYE